MARWVPAKWNDFLHKLPYYKGNSFEAIDEAAAKGLGIDIDLNMSRDAIFMATHYKSLWIEKYRYTEESVKVGICTKAQVGTVCRKKTTQLTAHQIGTLRTADGYGIITAGAAIRHARLKKVRIEFELKFLPTLAMLHRLAGRAREAWGTGWKTKVQVKMLPNFPWRRGLKRAKKSGFITFRLRCKTLRFMPWYVDFCRRG